MTTLRSDVLVRPYHDGDEPAVLALLRRSLGEGPGGDRSSGFFRWKHLDNPFGRSYLLVAEADDVIVGLRAFLRWCFTANGATVHAVRAVDTATDPDHQGQGIFSRLTRRALDDLRGEVDLVFNTPNGRSLPGYLKMGWQPVGRIPVAIRPRRPLRVAVNRRRLGLDHEPVRPRPAVDAPSVAAALDATGDLVREWAVAGVDDGRLETHRSAAFLAWRYAGAPLDYHAVWEQPHGRHRGGLAIFRVRPRGRLWETTLTEVLVPDGDGATTRSLLRRVVGAAATDHVAGHLGASTHLVRRGRAVGFIPAPGGPTLVVNPLGGPAVPDPLDLGSWALSLGDVEVF